jgi:hypothetical protein
VERVVSDVLGVSDGVEMESIASSGPLILLSSANHALLAILGLHGRHVADNLSTDPWASKNVKYQDICIVLGNVINRTVWEF